MKDIELTHASLRFDQPEDCCGRTNHDYQSITIETCNGGTSPEDTYYVISTERWAIDSADDLAALIEKIKSCTS